MELTLREALQARLISYGEEVRSGRHQPPPSPTAAPTETLPVAALVSHPSRSADPTWLPAAPDLQVVDLSA